jgi:hypothetical protein
MRKGDVRMKSAGLLPILALPLLAVDGVVVNGTTGKPQPKVAVSLIQPSQQGMQTLASAVTDASGRFNIDKAGSGDAPQLIQAVYEGVTYTKMLPPGSPLTGVQVEIYNATSSPGVVETEQHAIFLQPGSNTLEIAENILVKNDSRRTFNDPARGTLRFYLPPAANGRVRVTINTLGGMPIQREAEPSADGSNVYKVAYPIRPGETLFTMMYSLPASQPQTFESRILDKGGAVLVVPKGVAVRGDAQPAGEEPRFHAPKYALKSGDFKITLEGSGSFTDNGEGAAQNTANPSDTGQPQLTQSNPRLYDKLYLVLGLAGAILALGFVLLYRARAAAPGPPSGPAAKGKQRG